MAAQILKFPERPRPSFGTLDALLRDGHITPKQHWCGIHLRWLHQIQDRPTVTDDWRIARDREYRKAMEVLSGSEHTLTLCLRDWVDMSKLETVRCGLDALREMWFPSMHNNIEGERET